VDPIDRVHIDEKWFYLMENGTVVRIFPDEDGTLPPPLSIRNSAWT